ncbi:DUF1080 domain-containing protein [Pelagicoccus sp. SDUM812002]|uniref:3-keto-disaccharide hydrolase n=1 Tax=Pelagicoccus sp. SDUM812002 TaxID=3041266 RepID=UPI0028105D67|nr:DUF1080 domain-containing protein [Pelagicoccus sp. SDUM812002]MDQ8187440.1 DUF1080 domain-containing protein [Pelagicoccus sp. SDUM812002]
MKKSLILTAAVSIISIATAGQVSESQQEYIARYETHALKVEPEDALINTDKEPNLKKGFVDLYNGKDLDGWTALGGTCTFEPKGEAIVGTCVPGSPNTFLSTDRDDYSDFIFSAELKWAVDSNSGVIFRGRTKADENGRVYGPQAEMEGLNSDRGWSGGIYGEAAGGWLYPLWLDAHKEARAALKEGEWNRITIKADGKSIKTWVNGIPAANYETDTYFEGFFGLQIHSGKEGEVHFRNVKVKELAPKKKRSLTDLFENGDFSAWTKTGGGPVSDAWTIENAIVQRGGIRPGGINTKAEFEDFELRFDWKISEGGNSGVKYRAQGNLGLEYQILDDQKHSDGKLPSHRSGSLYDLFAAPDDKPIKPVGQWNSGRIVAKGNHIEHWLNGTKILDIKIGSEEWRSAFSASKYAEHEGFGSGSGAIHLQDHGDKVWYRNVQIRKL